MKLATWRLDNVEYIKAHSGLANDPLHLEIMNYCNTLAESMAEITRITAASEDKNNKYKQALFICCVPEAIAKFKLKQMDVSKLTKKELAAVLLVVYGANFLKELIKEDKPFLINNLIDDYGANKIVTDAYCISSV